MLLSLSCPDCGDDLRRAKRSLSEKLRFNAVYSCRSCPHREGISRLELWKVSPVSRCPECHNRQLRVLKRRDYIDRFNRNPFRLIQAPFNARLYHCPLCRLQFYDLRRLQSEKNMQRRPASLPQSANKE